MIRRRPQSPMPVSLPSRRLSKVAPCLGLLLYSTICTAAVSAQCQPGTPADETGLTFPDFGSQSFKAEMFGWNPSQYSTIHASEHFSKESGRRSAHVVRDGRYLFFLSENDTLRALGDNTGCFPGGGASLMGSLVHLTKLALDTKNVTFVEETELAGIPVSHWRHCVPYTGETGMEDLEVSLDVYVSISRDGGWEMYDGEEKSVLLRLSLEVFDGEESIDTYFLDVLEFENIEYDPDRFQADLEPPLGVVCLGLMQDQPQPGVPNSASFKQEGVSALAGFKHIGEEEAVIIDTDKQVLQKTSGPATTVRDFYGGATYFIVRRSMFVSRCIVTAVNNIKSKVAKDDVSAGFAIDDHYATMDSVEDYFYLSGDFTFSGEYEVRGIPCQVFTHITSNYGELSTAKIFLYFTKPGVSVSGRDGVTENKLVKIEVHVGDISTNKYNIYDLSTFDFDRVASEPFDITPCFDEIHRIEFVITFDRSEKTPMLGQERRLLEHAVRQQISELYGLSIARVHVGAAVATQNSVSVTGKLLARPDSGTHFDNFPNKSFGSGKSARARVLSVKDDVLTTADCAEMADSDPAATDADYCRDSEQCTLYREAEPGQQTDMVYDRKCSHMTKIKGYHTATSMSDAWATLEKSIFENQFKITVDGKTLTAKSIKKTFDKDATLHSGSPLGKFRKTANVQIVESEGGKLNKRMLLRECAEQCLHNLLFPCQAFSYCRGRSLCELHGAQLNLNTASQSGTGRPPNIRETDECDTYVRSYIDNFERVPGRVAKLTAKDSDVTLEKVTSEDSCARLCMEREDFQCESFDFCSQDDGAAGNCVLRKHHWRDFSLKAEGKIERNCSHFSRNYFWDYKARDGVTTLPVRSTLKDVDSAETCAYQCSASLRCDTFQFCEREGTTSCQFIDTSERKPAPGDMQPKFRCYTFVQKDDEDVQSRHDGLRKRVGTKHVTRNGFSIAAMFGMALIMFVVGVCLVFASLYGWYFFSRRQRQAANQQSPPEINMDNPMAEKSW